MVLDSEIRLTLNRIENALQHVLELRDFRNFQLAKSYLEEGQVHTALSFLKRIENATHNAQMVITQSLLIRALIMIYQFNFTDALALLVRIRKMGFEMDEDMSKDIDHLIKDIKIQQQASMMYDTAEGKEQAEVFKNETVRHLERYLLSARNLVKK
ncbi:MAG: hypothetical protein ACTSPV_12575 [Candidatus Hodarchaeales archaeon]